MRRKRFSVEQIVAILKQAEVGIPWRTCSARRESRSRRSTAGRSSTWVQVRQLREVQEEDVRLKRLVAELTLVKTMLQDVLTRKL